MNSKAIKLILAVTVLVPCLCLLLPAASLAEPSIADREAVENLVESWRQAWANKEIDSYIGFYAPAFQSRGMDRTSWRTYKNTVFQGSGEVAVRIWDVRVEQLGENLNVRFDQEYKSDIHSDYGKKELLLYRSSSGLRILRENWVGYPQATLPPETARPLPDFHPVVAKDLGPGKTQGQTSPSVTTVEKLPTIEPVLAEDANEIWARRAPALRPPVRVPVERRAPTSTIIVEEIAAKVNNAIITRSELQERHEEAPEYEEISRGYTGIERQEKLLQLRQAVLEDLINELLLLARADDLGVNVDQYVRRYLEDVKAESGVTTDEELEALLEVEGMSLARYKDRIRRRKIPQRLVFEEVTSRVEISEQEIIQWYQDNLDKFQLPPTVSLSEIVLLHEKNEDETAVRKVADEIYSRLQSGVDFSDLARRFSETPSRDAGGTVGRFGKEELSPEIAQWAFAAVPLSISSPIRTLHGFHILRLDERVEAAQTPLETVHDEIEQHLSDLAWNKKLQEYLEDLYRTNTIVVNEEYQLNAAVPAGESSTLAMEARR